MKQPNILLIMVDEMRGDCLSCADHPDVKTPHIDHIASNGIRFENAYSSCPSCIPARAALFTGMSQKNHGRVGYQDGIRWEYENTLAGELTKSGYETHCCGKMHVHPLRSLQGFMGVDLCDGYLHAYRKCSTPYYENQNVADDYFYELKEKLGVTRDITDTGLGCNSWVARPWPYEEALHPTNWVTDKSLDFLRRRDRDKPFFLMTSYVRPHAPYDAPELFFKMYQNKELRPPVKGDWDDLENLKKNARNVNNDTGPMDEELIRQQMIGYYACITHVDYQIGRLLQALDDQEVTEDTIILFLSDHGELLSDHALVRKARPYRGSAQVPFIISGNSRYVTHNGSVTDTLVELRDVMPTLLDFANRSIPDSVDGFSLRKEIESGQKEEHREYLHGEHSYASASNHFVVTKKDKYIWYSQKNEENEQYFNLEHDPYETKNEIHKECYNERVQALREHMISELVGRPEGYTDGTQLIVGCQPRAYIK